MLSGNWAHIVFKRSYKWDTRPRIAYNSNDCVIRIIVHFDCVDATSSIQFEKNSHSMARFRFAFRAAAVISGQHGAGVFSHADWDAEWECIETRRTSIHLWTISVVLRSRFSIFLRSRRRRILLTNIHARRCDRCPLHMSWSQCLPPYHCAAQCPSICIGMKKTAFCLVRCWRKYRVKVILWGSDERPVYQDTRKHKQIIRRRVFFSVCSRRNLCFLACCEYDLLGVQFVICVVVVFVLL